MRAACLRHARGASRVAAQPRRLRLLRRRVTAFTLAVLLIWANTVAGNAAAKLLGKRIRIKDWLKVLVECNIDRVRMAARWGA